MADLHAQRLNETLFGGINYRLVPLKYAALAASVAATITFIRWLRDTKETLESEATIMTCENEDTVALEELEGKFETVPGRVRINTVPNSWNVVHGDIPAHTSGSKNLVLCVSRNIYQASVSDGKHKKSTHVLGVCGSFAIINLHAIQKMSHFTISLIPRSGSTVTIKSEIDVELDVRPCGDDIGVIRLSGVRFKDIIKHFHNAPVSVCKGIYMEQQGSIKMSPSSHVVRNGSCKFSLYQPYVLKGQHAYGQCGRPLIGEIGAGSAILGIHAAGNLHSNHIFFSQVLRNGVVKAVESLKTDVLFNIVAEASHGMQLKDCVNRKSPFRFEDLPLLKYFGSLDEKVLAKQKSKLVKTPFFSKTEEMLFSEFDFVPTESYERPMMEPKVLQGEYVSPYNIALRKMSKQRGSVNRKILRRCIDEFSGHIVRHLKNKGVEEIKPYDAETAINGFPGDDYLRRVNVATSGGFGYPGKKKVYLPQVDDFKREMRADLLQDVVSLLEKLEKGRPINAIFKASCKDEPRLAEKARAGKTRIFYPGSLPLLVVAKMLLGPFYTLMIEHPDIFFCGLGYNYGVDAPHIYQLLTSFASRFMEGDYGGYDVSMCPDITWGAYSVIILVLKELGYNESALRACEGLCSAYMFPLVAMLSELFMAMITSSGKLGTAEDNSIKGVLILMVSYYSSGKECGSFFEKVKPLIYGDDMIAAVKQDAVWFDNLYHQRFCNDVLNMSFTDAEKGVDMKPFKKIHEVSFLRRRFVLFKGRIRAQLTLNSMPKMLNWMIPSKEISRDDQMSAMFSSFLWEVYHYVEKDQFDRLSDWGKAILIKESGYVSKLPTYEEIQHVVDHNLVAESKDMSSQIAIDEEELRSVSDLVSCMDDNTYVYIADTLEPVLIRAIQIEFILSVWEESYGQLPSCAQWPAEFTMFLQDKLTSLESEYRKMKEEKFDFPPELVGLKRADIISLERYGTDSDFREQCDSYLTRKGKLEANRLTRGLLRRSLARNSRVSLVAESADGDIKANEGGTSEMRESLHDSITGPAQMGDVGVVRTLNIGEAEMLRLNQFLARPVLLTVFQHIVGADITQAINVWDAWSSDLAVRNKLANYAYLTGTLCVQINPNGMPFHYCKYLCGFVPFPDNNEPYKFLTSNPTYAGIREAFLTYLSQAPGARVFDVRLNKPIVHRIPFMSPQPVARLYNDDALVLPTTSSYNDLANLGVLCIRNINPLRAVSSSPSDVSFSVYAWLEDAKLGTVTGTEIALTAESKNEDERIKGPVETMSMAAASALDVVSPVVGPFAVASATVARGVGKFASVMGWSVPTMNTEPHRMKNQPFQNAANTIGYDTGKRITLDPKQEVSIDPGILGMGEDEMSIKHVCGIESYLSTSTWQASIEPLGSPLWICPVSPRITPTFAQGIIPGDKVFAAPTALAFAATPFNFWRGEITYRFEFVMSQYHRGRIAVGFEPNIAQRDVINSTLQLNKQFIKVFDLTETRDFTLTVKWASPRPYLRNIPNLDVLGPGGPSAPQPFDRFPTCNGYIWVTPLTALQSPDGSDIDFNVYVHSKEMHFNGIDEDLLPDDLVAESRCLQSEEKVPEYVLNESTASHDNVATVCFGEEPLSFRGCLKRFHTTLAINIFPTGSTEQIVAVEANAVPIPAPNYGEVGVLSEIFGSDLLAFLRYAFVGLKGGMRKRVRVIGTDTASAMHHAKVSLSYDDNYIDNVGSTDNSSGRSTRTGTVSFVPDTNGGIEFEIPWYTTNVWGFSFSGNVLPNFSTVDTRAVRRYLFSYDIPGLSSPIRFVEETATGEDFNLLRFQGAHPFVIAEIPR